MPDAVTFSNLYKRFFLGKIKKMAGVTRLELAASGVTGRRSNQTELHPRDFLPVRPESFEPRCIVSTRVFVSTSILAQRSIINGGR